jgi:dTDP-4-amino-4,6-dideoxygalactose transaminase
LNKQFIFDEPIFVTKAKLPEFEQYSERIKSIWKNNWLTNNGPLLNELKGKLTNYLNVSEIELFSNGHQALEIAIKALDLKGEIITTPFTFVSTVHAIKNCGIEPVFCDIDPVTLNINPDEIVKLITPKTSAILPVHVFGVPCDHNQISEIAKKHNLKLIYDAAHAFGVEVDGKGIGTFGDVSMFSLHATKVYNTIEGGALTFNDRQFGGKVFKQKNFGLSSATSVDFVGTNAKLNEFQAAMGLCNLESINEDIANREAIYHAYCSKLKDVNINFIEFDKNVKANYSYFPILLPNKEIRDLIFENLQKYNIFTRKYFYPVCNDFECYKETPYLTPIARDIGNRVLCLPMYSELSIDAVNQISNALIYELSQTNVLV